MVSFCIGLLIRYLNPEAIASIFRLLFSVRRLYMFLRLYLDIFGMNDCCQVFAGDGIFV